MEPNGRLMATPRFLTICIAVLLLPPTNIRAADWVSPLHQDHPLIGKIWQPSAGRFVPRRKLELQARRAEFIVLGETHNNRDHHNLQAELVRGLIAAGRRPALVFEMINEDQQPNVDLWRKTNPTNAVGLGRAVNWARSGWPAWALYRPIAEPILAAGLPIRAGNPPRKLTREISRRGFTALGGKKHRLGLGTPLPSPAEKAIRRDLFESHCKLIPVDRLTPLVAVQRARDAILADNLISGRTATNTNSAVLIAGSGHGRRDHGVPFYLASRNVTGKVLSLALMQMH